jgi:CDP-diacylglycerol--glycerol-3-phosphate 3-phosphatidyltransferase
MVNGELLIKKITIHHSPFTTNKMFGASIGRGAMRIITAQHSLLNVFLAGAGMIGSVMVSYTTARSESIGVKSNVGFLQRPERVVLLIIGALSTVRDSNAFLANRMPQVLWILAVGSIWTFVHRMYHTWRELKISDK